MGIERPFDIRVGYSTQLDTFYTQNGVHILETGTRPFYVLEYPGEGKTHTFHIVFRDVKLERATVEDEKGEVNYREQRITSLIVSGEPKERIPSHALAEDFGLPVVSMRLDMVDGDLVGLVKNPFFGADVRVSRYGTTKDTGEKFRSDLFYQAQESGNTAVLINERVIIQRTTILKGSKPRTGLTDLTGDDTIILTLGQEDLEPNDIEKLVQPKAPTYIDWVATAGMYLTGTTPYGDELTAEDICIQPVVCATGAS